MDLNTEGFNVIGTVRTSSEITQIELDLIPTFIKSHWHSTNEWFDSCGGLVITGSEPSANVLVIQDLNLESEILLQILDDHH